LGGSSAKPESGGEAKPRLKLLFFYTFTFTEVAKIKLPALYKKIIYKNINLRLNVRHDWLVGQLEDPLDTDSSHFGALVPL